MPEPAVPSPDPRASGPSLGADERLATYGTLAPGRPNHHHVQGLPGRWFTGHVHGHLFDIGWDDYLARGGICVVEWSENVEDIFDGTEYSVTIEKLSEDDRKITVTGPSARA